MKFLLSAYLAIDLFNSYSNRFNRGGHLHSRDVAFSPKAEKQKNYGCC